ncbi:hypothetical protein MUK42_06417 [Musa troglodytarum]|uniref:Uncharacterized protein n=1 Tax=Musa troglodytarum TaxID=320322 RepID=A0A9E7KYW6_9LILI|nr:hypothetical protein MUK42_06417 [Musa troglodytarum]
MRSSIATYRESLSRIANEVLDTADELESPRSRLTEGESPASARRLPRRLSRISPLTGSPTANGVDSGPQDEEGVFQGEASKGDKNGDIRGQRRVLRRARMEDIAKYKADILKLQASEAEIRALSVNYAAILMEKEEQLSKLREENGSLRKSFEASALHPSRDESHKTLTNSSNALKVVAEGVVLLGILSAPPEGPEERQLNESYLSNINDLKMDKERSSIELKELRKELNEKISELRQLDAELKKRVMEQESNISLENAKNMIVTLEKENAKLKIEKDDLEQNLKLHVQSTSEKAVDTTEDVEKMILSIKRLEEELIDTRKGRDKALQELARLKQHLLEKELEDSDKMDEDSKMIEDLRANCEQQRAHTALGQYYAESEAKANSDQIASDILPEESQQGGFGPYGSHAGFY